ncbi:hypothetical protein [Rickettsiales endosymbiont of Trichoplax sp. H2]|nr:hypothetical protein [Rickettsiales endosymbiont of Trichoplax sp. H2]
MNIEFNARLTHIEEVKEYLRKMVEEETKLYKGLSKRIDQDSSGE